MSTQHSILLVGESNVGKTHYGAQFLKRLMVESCALKRNGAATNLEAFTTALSCLADGKATDHAGNWFLGLLSIRAVTAALAFFGIGGMVALTSGATELAALGVAVGAGLAALFLVAQIMQSLIKLKADGTL